MTCSTSALRVEPFHQHVRPAPEIDALFAGGWPAFIDADPVAVRHLPDVRSTFPELEIALLRDQVLVAAGWGVPISWDESIEDLPSGYSDSLGRALADHHSGAAVNTLVICAAQVRPDVARSGLAGALLQGLIQTAHDDGLDKVIAPLRPTAKSRYPLTPIEDYAGWTRADGLPFDPWLRTHVRMGAQLLTTNNASQTFVGTVTQWERWSDLALPGSGSYVIPDALSALHLDLAADQGTCIEPTIWVRHR